MPSKKRQRGWPYVSPINGERRRRGWPFAPQKDEGAWQRKRKPTVASYPAHLRGPAQNRFGGHQAQRIRAKGTFGAASEGRRLSPEEIRKLEVKYVAAGLVEPRWQNPSRRHPRKNDV